MAFVDEVTIYAQGGHGGAGVVRWLHAKGKAKGGPSGGDGGRGGDIILEGVRDLAALSNYRYEKKFRGEDGDSGDANNRHGKDGKPVILKVPVGTIAKDTTRGEIFEILEAGERKVIFKGGPGGFGNNHFKASTNQNPDTATQGKMGMVGDIHITLKLIADVGFVGFPNAGKSSLLNSLTRAQSKVAAYPFTTLDPYLGDLYGYLLADIPGLIEGASTGKGLGSKFLRHIERTRFIAHLISAEQENPLEAYKNIRKELEVFGTNTRKAAKAEAEESRAMLDAAAESRLKAPVLAEKTEIVVLSKVDLLLDKAAAEGKSPAEAAKEVEKVVKMLEKETGKEVLTISILDDASIKRFSDRLVEILRADEQVRKATSDAIEQKQKQAEADDSWDF
jgi:GTP-binding protein